MSRCEQDCRRTALRFYEQRSLFHACPVHDRAYLVHALFQGRYVCDRIRHTRAGLVVEGETAERGEAPKEVRDPGVRPREVQVRDEARTEDEYTRTAAEHLVGDADSVRARRVTRLRRLHGLTLFPVEPGVLLRRLRRAVG